jgi:hypothetical protein
MKTAVIEERAMGHCATMGGNLTCLRDSRL